MRSAGATTIDIGNAISAAVGGPAQAGMRAQRRWRTIHNGHNTCVYDVVVTFSRCLCCFVF